MWQVCLLVKYNIKAKSVCVCVSLYLSLCVCVSLKKLILIYLQRTCWHHEFEMTESAFWRMKTMIRILTLTYTLGICQRKQLQGQKLILSAGSMFMPVYIIFIDLASDYSIIQFEICGTEFFWWLIDVLRPLLCTS